MTVIIPRGAGANAGMVRGEGGTEGGERTEEHDYFLHFGFLFLRPRTSVVSGELVERVVRVHSRVETVPHTIHTRRESEMHFTT